MRSAKCTLGNTLGRLQLAAGLSDAELARRAGLSRSQLNRIRNRRAIPRVRTAIALAASVGCRVAGVFYLIDGDRSR